MMLRNSFGVLLGLLATTRGQGPSPYYSGPAITSQQTLYAPSQLLTQGQQIPWSIPNFPLLPYQYQQGPYQYPFFTGFPYSVPGQFPGAFQHIQPTVEITTPIIKEVDVVEPPAVPVPVPVPNIVPVSNMEAALLEMENQGKLHAEKYYYGRSEIPFYPGMVPSYPPATTQYQYYEIPKYPSFQSFPYPNAYPPQVFPSFPYQQPFLIPPPTQPQLPNRPPTDRLPQQQEQQQTSPGGTGGTGGTSGSSGEPGTGGSGGPGTPGIPISPYLKPNQQVDPDGRPFTVNKRKHMEIYEYH